MNFFQEKISTYRKNNPFLFFFFASWILVAFLLIFLDLPLSIYLVDYNSSWAKFIALYGEFPGHLVLSISIFVLITYGVNDSNWSNDLIKISGLILNSVFITSIFYTLLPETAWKIEEGMIVIGLVLICQGVTMIFIKQKGLNPKQKYVDAARTSFLLGVINPLLFVQSFKILWGRMRFRDLTGNYQGFTSWIIPQGITGHKSFPSGHTAMGWMVLPILFLLPRTGKLRRVIQGMIYLWGTIVGVGRIVIGAHYASDVLFSTGVAFTAYFYLINRKERKNSQQHYRKNSWSVI